MGFAAGRAVAAIKVANGAEQTILDADGAVVVEPMLESIRAHIAGAIHAPGEEVGDAYRFCVEAQSALTVQSGCAGLYGTAVARIGRSDERREGKEGVRTCRSGCVRLH